MPPTLQIISSGVDLDADMKQDIVDHVGRMTSAFGDRLHGCRVLVTRPPARAGMARVFRIGLRVTLKDVELGANPHEHPEFRVALERAFESMRRQIRTLRPHAAVARSARAAIGHAHMLGHGHQHHA
jgi:ribosome-associated translation inhibitor RaiA